MDVVIPVMLDLLFDFNPLHIIKKQGPQNHRKSAKNFLKPLKLKKTQYRIFFHSSNH